MGTVKYEIILEESDLPHNYKTPIWMKKAWKNKKQVIKNLETGNFSVVKLKPKIEINKEIIYLSKDNYLIPNDTVCSSDLKLNVLLKRIYTKIYEFTDAQTYYVLDEEFIKMGKVSDYLSKPLNNQQIYRLFPINGKIYIKELA